MIYEFNECGVCTNPTIYGETIIRKGNVTTNKISVAQLPDGHWCYGIDMNDDSLNSGYSFAPSASRGGFLRKRDAVIAAVKFLRFHAQRDSERRKEPYNKVLDCCNLAEKQIFEEQQLSLF